MTTELKQPPNKHIPKIQNADTAEILDATGVAPTANKIILVVELFMIDEVACCDDLPIIINFFIRIFAFVFNCNFCTVLEYCSRSDSILLSACKLASIKNTSFMTMINAANGTIIVLKLLNEYPNTKPNITVPIKIENNDENIIVIHIINK